MRDDVAQTIQGVVRELLLHKHRINYEFAIAPEAHSYLSAFCDEAYARIVQEIAAQEIKTLSHTYPATWWGALKDRWVPRFLKRFVRINYNSMRFDAKLLYPKLVLPNQPTKFIMWATPISFSLPEEDDNE
jgi:hypothetical protein